MHVLFIGAHPDDCDFSCGGTAASFAARGHHVKFVSVTNGDRGHFWPEYQQDRTRLAARRMVEARKAVEVFGGEFECMDVHDGAVYVTEELTERMVALIRS
ncbi:MAG TPA: PIG-L family deacetylase, partial [Armatimonadota bacterium]|nr:PIG-L family deacetylase [Armatimonadota bacterium]